MSNVNVNEEWKQAPNDPHVEASNFGRLRYTDTHEIVKIATIKNEYPSYGNRKNNDFNFVHRTVAFTWCENPDPEHYDIVDHIDGNPKNHHPSNLRWCTKSMNARYGIARRKALGIPMTPKRFDNETAKKMRLEHIHGKSINTLAVEYNIASANMSAIINNKVYKDPNWFEQKGKIIEDKLYTAINKSIISDVSTNCLSWKNRGLEFTVTGVDERFVKNLKNVIKDWGLRVKLEYRTIEQNKYECVIY